jgi:hypothetical protein
VISRTTSWGRIDALKTKGAQVEFIDENVDHAHWIFFGYVIVQALRQQGDLRPSLTFNESLHGRPRSDLDDQKVRQSLAFSHSLDPKRTQGTAVSLQAVRCLSVSFQSSERQRSGRHQQGR